jgi:hypothetical protein
MQPDAKKISDSGCGDIDSPYAELRTDDPLLWLQ